MAVVRRRQALLNIDLPNNSVKAELCPLSALFLIYFDNKTGYAISWKRSLPGVEVEGVVEYKSLPSGVHSIKQDLIYFIHGDYNGLSAFINVPAATESRNARMIAVGVMVPLCGGKLGRCWEHAEELKGMANSLVVDTSMTKVLEDYWEKHKAPSSLTENRTIHLPLLTSAGLKSLPTSPSQPRCHSRSRSLSDSQLLNYDGNTISKHHPAWSMVNLLDTFGPLIFPLYRAALLRKRILITTHAPVQETCNFVYDISVLSSIPLIGRHFLEHNESLTPLRPLFSIGVRDITLLEEECRRAKSNSNISQSDPLIYTGTSSRGWIACTTDSILAMKHLLYDVLVKMPTSRTSGDGEKLWPRLESPPGVELKATQRDFRRYKALRSTLSLRRSSFQDLLQKTPNASNESDVSHLLSYKTSMSYENIIPDIPAMGSIIEPVSWSAFAYSNLTWWSSAGEQHPDVCIESELDTLLLSGLFLPLTSYPNAITEDIGTKHDTPNSLEMAIITYFHRMTIQILTTLENITNVNESEDEQFDENNPLQGNSEYSEYGSRTPIFVTSADVVKMGLDIWSESDHQFIQNLVREYIGRRSLIEGLKLEMCGIRIC